MRFVSRTSDDSWLSIPVQVLGPEPIVLNYTPCPNQYLTFPLLLKFFHYSTYHLTLLFRPICYPTFPVMTLAIALAWRPTFILRCFLSLGNAFNPTSCGWRCCSQLHRLKVGSNGCCFSVCQESPAGTALLTGEGYDRVWFEGHQACLQKLPWQLTWNASQGSLALLLKITWLFWIWILLPSTPTFSYWNNCFPTDHWELKFPQDFTNCVIEEVMVLGKQDFCFF